MKTRLFISYSHHDTERVVSIVRQLTLKGYDIWMDKKDIEPGDNYILKIFEGVHSSDVYVVFLSNSSVSSNYVIAELSHAIKKSIDNPAFKIIPILLEDISIPPVIANIDYIDARSVSSNVIVQLSQMLNVAVDNKIDKLQLTSVEFTISQNSTVEFDSKGYYTNQELTADCDKILYELRNKVYGILMNFVSIDAFDLMSETPQFTNGIYVENMTTESGSTIGSNCKRISLTAIAFRPDEKKVKSLIENNSIPFESVTLGFSLPLKDDESYEIVGKKCLSKLKEKYVFLEYNVKNGAKIELSEDFYLSFAITEEQVRIMLNSKYDFQLKKYLKDFDIYKFLYELLKSVKVM